MYPDLTMAAINQHVQSFADAGFRAGLLIGLQSQLTEIRNLPETNDCPMFEQHPWCD